MNRSQALLPNCSCCPLHRTPFSNYVHMRTCCLVPRPQIAVFGLRTQLAHAISASMSHNEYGVASSLQAAGQTAIYNAIDKYVGKTLQTTISCTIRFVAFCFTIELHVQALPAYSPSYPNFHALTAYMKK